MNDPAVSENQSMQDFRRCRREQGKVHWARENFLAVLDAQTAQRLEAANYADLTMLDGFADVVRGHASEPVSWQQLRAGWAGRMRHLSSTEGLRVLVQRMDGLLAAEAGKPQDLVWLAERVAVETLVPAIIDGLDAGAHRRVLREVMSKVAWVLSDVDGHRASRLHQMKMVLLQVIAGWEVRRELKARARGRRPRRSDLTDPVVDLIPELGLDRAVDTVTSLLTAITGSPGAAAACLFFELNRRHEWRARLEAELSAIPLERLYESPVRDVRTDIAYGDVALKKGQFYVLSSFLLHHDDSDWPNPEAFDPERWLGAARREQCPHGSYVPFGWAPKSCIGASLGMAQLVLLAHLLCTRYRLQVPEPERASMAVASVVRPRDFHGAVLRREEGK